MIGTTLGHFRILSNLADSGGGEVYRAEDEALRRHVALEVLSPMLASDPDHKARFLSAARAAAAVTHPNLAAIHEVGESDGRVWVAMELVEGASLRTRLRGRPLPLLETLKIGEQVAEGLAAAHEKGLAHGDLRAEKVRLRPGGQVKVIELGLAGGATTGPRDDVYRLGAMLYEMATGEAPRAGADLNDAGKTGHAAAATVTPSTLNPDVPAELGRIIGACLEPDPEDRYQHAGGIATDLGQLRRLIESASVAVSSSVMSPPHHRAPWTPRRIALWSAAIVALAAVLGLAARQWVWPLLRPAPPFKAGDRYIVADFVNETSDIVLGIALREFMEGLRHYVTLVAVSRWGEKEVAALDAAAAEARCLKGECEGYVTGRLAGDPEHYRLEIALHRVGRTEPVVALSSDTDATRIGDAVDAMVKEAARILGRMPGVGQPPELASSACLVWSGDANALKAWHALPMDSVIEPHPAESLAASRNALELDPRNPGAHWLVGSILFNNLGRRSEGLPHLKEGLRLRAAAAETRPECRGTALEMDIWYLARTWSYDDLAERANRAVRMFPNFPAYWLYYADITERAMGDPGAGLPYFRKAYELYPELWKPLARALWRAGRIDEIDALIDDYRRRPGDHPDREEEIAGVRIFTSYVRGDDYGAIFEMMQRPVKEGQPPPTYDFSAEMLAAVGRLAEAEGRDREVKVGQRTTAAMSGTQAGGGYGRLDWLEKRRTGTARVLNAAERDSCLQGDDSLNDLARMSVVLGTAVSLKEVLRTIEEEQKDNRSRRALDAIRFSRGCLALVEGRGRRRQWACWSRWTVITDPRPSSARSTHWRERTRRRVAGPTPRESTNACSRNGVSGR